MAFSLWPPLIGAVEALDRRAGERQVADRVEHLVAHELVGVAQALRIDAPRRRR